MEHQTWQFSSTWTCPFSGCSLHLVSSNSFSWNQILPALLSSFAHCVSRWRNVMMVQPMQAVQWGKKLSLYSDPANTNDSGRGPLWYTCFWPQNQEKCQNHKEQTGTGVRSWRTTASLILSTKNTCGRIWVTWTYLTLCSGEMSAARLWGRMGSRRRDTLSQTHGHRTHRQLENHLIPSVNCTNI